MRTLFTAAIVFMAATSVLGDANRDLSLRWHVESDEGANDFAFAAAIQGNRIFSAGVSGSFSCLSANPFAACRMIVRADSTDGGLLWKITPPGIANALSTRGDIVFVAGAGVDAAGRRDFRVRAVSQGNGTIVWENGFRPPEALGAEAFAIAVSGDRLFAAGHIITGTAFGTTEFLIRAYDIHTGEALWQDRSPAAAFLDRYFGLAVSGRTVVASGGRRFNFLIRAYDVETGALNWADVIDGGMGFDEAKKVAIDKGRLFAVGELATSAGVSRDFFAKAYDERTGESLWSSQLDTGGFDFLTDVRVKSDQVFVAGIGGAACRFFGPGDCQWLLRAHDVKTGAVRWENWFNTESDQEQPFGMEVRGSRVYMVGQGGQICPIVCDVIARIYDADTGAVLAHERFDLHGGDDTLPAMALGGPHMVVVGATESVRGDYDYFVRAYRIANDQ